MLGRSGPPVDGASCSSLTSWFVPAASQKGRSVSPKYARTTVSTGGPSHWRPWTRLSPPDPSRLVVILLAVAAGVGAAFAGCHPTGTRVADVIETAAFAAGFTLLASRSAQGTWLVVGVAAVALARGWLLVPALATIVVALGSVFPSRIRRRVGSMVGALGSRSSCAGHPSSSTASPRSWRPHWRRYWRSRLGGGLRPISGGGRSSS